MGDRGPGWYARLQAEGGREGCGVIAVSALGVGVGLLGLPILTIGLFMGPLQADFGWSRAEIAGASFCINLATMIAAPLIGKQCDRVGVRPVAVFSLLALATGFLALAAVPNSTALYYAIWFALSAGGVGTSGIVWTRAVGSYFRSNRGLALGLTLTGTAFAALLAPLTLGSIIAAYGWRAGFLTLSAISLLTVPPVLALFGERRGAPGAAAVRLPGYTLAEAVGQANFWKMAIGIFLVVLGMGSFLVHFVPLAIDQGVAPRLATQLYAVIGLSMLIGRIAIGVCLDRFNPLLVTGISLAVPALACLLLLSGLAAPVPAMVVVAAIIGFCAGAEIDILAYLVARYFGLRAYGAIYGCQLTFFAAGSGFGSVLTGHVHDVSKSYHGALLAGVVVFVLGALAMASLAGRGIDHAPQ